MEDLKKKCYIAYTYKIFENKSIDELKKYDFINGSYKKRAIVISDSERPGYRDPDLVARSEKIIKNDLEKYLGLEDLFKQNDLRLAPDYLGPSTTVAAKHQDAIPDKKAWKTIIDCRRIGGQMVWPRNTKNEEPNNTINCKRAKLIGAISDRIDVCLYEIKNYLEDYSNKDYITLNEELKNSFETINAKKFFKFFKNDFKEFCDRFKLVGSFVNDDYSIIFFNHVENINRPIELLNITNKNKNINKLIKEFYKNNKKAVDKRTNKIIEDYKKTQS